MKTVTEFKKMKSGGEKISVVTCYDFWSAQIIDETNVDSVLVGDSASMVMHGFESTVNAEIEMMRYHVAAVKRGLKNKFLIADLPFLEHRKGFEQLISSIDKLMKAGAQALKIEGAEGNIEMINRLTSTGIPVMGHLGLTPQSVHQFGGFKLQGREEAASKKIFEDALQLQQAGCFSIVLEMIPSALAKKITDELEIPTIGIGAGSDTDGQVLVLQDLLGMNKNFNPKFVRKYLSGFELIKNALNNFSSDIKENKFPTKEESY
ncbi:MAG: 3-methyl-2-oxobutanoate hydroxymethyltransferase [Ignavibacteriales bacterium]|nr:3-methyl-2-oxobutanoate hydroxymethyltransferase [Ignavibacteriales bacterium]